MYSRLKKRPPTPVFIIFFNRAVLLRRAIASYKQLNNIQIIIHDNGSDEEDALRYLKELEGQGVIVNRRPKIQDKSELENVNYSITKYFRFRKKVNYIVTDPDIELLPDAENTIKVYQELLAKFPEVESVGPMLKIDTINKGYPLYNSVINRHREQFWQHKPTIVELTDETVALLPCKIDTTFAMHRAGKPFKRLSSGLRLYDRYSAEHLDWHEVNFTKDSYYEQSSAAISHWSNKKFHHQEQGETIKKHDYFDVKQTETGLKIVKKEIQK